VENSSLMTSIEKLIAKQTWRADGEEHHVIGMGYDGLSLPTLNAPEAFQNQEFSRTERKNVCRIDPIAFFSKSKVTQHQVVLQLDLRYIPQQ
jgi:hypothetical protein